MNDTREMNENNWSSGHDVIVVGAGVAGCALAYALAKDGRQVLLIERDLSEPNKMAGELLQPGGYLKILELGLQGCVNDIDAQEVYGYAVYSEGESITLPYPLDKYSTDVAGKAFHHGRFIQNLRRNAASLPNVELEIGTVTSLLEEESGTNIVGVQYKATPGHLKTAHAPLTVLCDGRFSKFRRSLGALEVNVLSYFVGLTLKNCKLPYPNYANGIFGEPSIILFYSISKTEIRCLVDIPAGPHTKFPSMPNGEMSHYLKMVIAPQLPDELKNAFLLAVDSSEIRRMPNCTMPTCPYRRRGAILIGDALNMRHPITGSGMMAALSDVVILRDLLRSLHDLNDASMVFNRLESFYTLRKPSIFVLDTLADAAYKLTHSAPRRDRKQIRRALYEYMRLTTRLSHVNHILAQLSGLNASPCTLFMHMAMVGLFCLARLLLPFPTPSRVQALAIFLSDGFTMIWS